MIAVAMALALAIAGLRWLRVAQREHYLAGRTWAIALMWYRLARTNLAVTVGAYLMWGAVVALPVPTFAMRAGHSVIVVAAAALPLGLAWRGRGRRLAWTARVRRLAGVYLVLTVLLVTAVAMAAPSAWVSLVCLTVVILSPLLMDVALRLAAPWERALASTFVEQATSKVRRVDPTIVGITGSYGKTSTKGVLLHLLSGGNLAVQATPGSFNNLLGISRSINENLVLGTDVFIAEMGTYGRGEIAQLVETFPVDIACITAIGDVHLERMGSRANIAVAKSEIMANARKTVLCIDYPELAELAAQHRDSVLTCSGLGAPADVSVAADEDGHWRIDAGTESARIELPAAEMPTQVAACAVALGLCLDQPFVRLVQRLASASSVSHRAELSERPGEPAVIDDTFNSNLDGATHALNRAVAVARHRSGSAWVVTPGMVELGHEQVEQNSELARRVVASGARLIVVGRTNRAALLSGGGPDVVTCASRSAATEHVFAHADQRDVILFENDLPDHYP